ncbi:hypothetical protein FVEN_g13119 [Fusarium venenatum]|nr:hypothetical protein FVEN_g13119 [Fusarium venenatum]
MVLNNSRPPTPNPPQNFKSSHGYTPINRPPVHRPQNWMLDVAPLNVAT